MAGDGRRLPTSRRTGPVVGVLLAAAAGIAIGIPAAARAVPSAHADAVQALHDVRYAVGEITHAESLTSSGPAPFRQAARHALAALLGASAPGAAHSGDPLGALARLQRALRAAPDSRSAPWRTAVEGARVNLQAAASSLRAALDASGLDEYQMSISDALVSLQVAIGRPNELGTLGGLEGALATTALGVPAHAVVLSGCNVPARAPAYGTAGGYLLFVTLPRTGNLTLPPYLGGRRFRIGDKLLVVYTAAARNIAALCKTHRPVARTAADPPPRLYTPAQAQRGEAVYTAHCASCHGKDLQGTAAPAVAGKEFLTTAAGNGWTLSDLRYLVVSDMPRDAPGSLSPRQYAAVLAYLLAANCYPPGKQPFPTQEPPSFAKLRIAVPPAVAKAHGKGHTCRVP